MFNNLYIPTLFNISKYVSIINQDLDNTKNVLSETIPKIIDKCQKEGIELNPENIQIAIEEIFKELYTQQYQIWVIYIDEVPVSYAFTHETAVKRMYKFASKIKFRQFCNYPTIQCHVEEIDEDHIMLMNTNQMHLFAKPQRYKSIYIEPISNVK